MYKIENTNIDKKLESVYISIYSHIINGSIQTRPDCIFFFKYNLSDYYKDMVNKGIIDLNIDLLYVILNHNWYDRYIKYELDIVKYLCELPLSMVVDCSNEILTYAAIYGKLDIVKYLCELPLSRGVYFGEQNHRVLPTLASNGYIDVIKYLCELPKERGVDPTVNDNDTIRTARGADDTETVTYLLSLDSVLSCYIKFVQI